MIIDGRAIAEQINQHTAQKVALLRQQGHTVTLAVILVGDDLASQTYVRKKGAKAKELGMEFTLRELPQQTTTAELITVINELQTDHTVHGLIIQLPLPAHIDTAAALNAVRPNIDVDCLTDVNLGKLMMDTGTLAPPTPGAILSVLEHLQTKLAGKNVTIIGAGPLVGRPLAVMLVNANASVTVCNSETRDIKTKCVSADIIVTGVGKKDLVRGDMVRKDAIVIDAGIDFVNEKMYGDVNLAEVEPIAAHVTPTPGGIGPITVARLLSNTVLCAEENLKNK